MMRYIVIITLLCWACLTWADNTNKTQTQAKIQKLDQSIQQIKHKIQHTQHKKHHWQHKLKQLDQQIGHINKQLHHTRQSLSSTQNNLNKTKKHYQQQKHQLQQQQKHLASIIQVSYQMGGQPYLKLILNQQNPQTIQRYLHYARAITQYQMHWLSQIQTTLNHIKQDKKQLTKKRHQLQHLKQQQKTHQKHLKQRKQQRQQVIDKLNQTLQHSHKRLQHFKANKAHLEKLLKRVSRHNHYHVQKQHFYQTKGELAWPIDSRHIRQDYGQPQLDGRVKSSGLLIGAENGQPIHAIFQGQVVFAHWLRGYGLMIVIQHSSHYMTLYAHAQSLYAQSGDKVAPGDIIATVGQSGGLEHSALYFEIRHNGHAVNPHAWLKNT